MASLAAAWSPAGAIAPARATQRTPIVRAQLPKLPNPFAGNDGEAPAPAARAPSKINPMWTEPILDESLPDPVFDDKYEYKGRSKVGFVSFAETLNGRAAMLGFTILFMQELVMGKGVLEMYGLPCTLLARKRTLQAAHAMPC
eukprot:scaffold217396_cov36-Tisochrysis_lutea.AAC.1